MNSYRPPMVLIACILLLSGGGVWAQNTVRWSTNYYSINGATLPELRQSIRQNRPWKEKFEHDAMTDWRVNWQFNVTPSANGCRCSSFGTQTTIVVSMPRWVAPTNAPETVRQIWTQYAAALGRHEAGHAAFAFAAAAEMHKRVKAAGVGAECEGLKKLVNDLCQQVIEEHRKRDKEYDEKTRHGATQGAVMPGRVRRER